MKPVQTRYVANSALSKINTNTNRNVDVNGYVERRPGHMTPVMQSAGSSTAFDTTAVSQFSEDLGSKLVRQTFVFEARNQHAPGPACESFCRLVDGLVTPHVSCVSSYTRISS